MTAWDSLPAALRSAGPVEGLRPLLQDVEVQQHPDGPLPGESGTWRRWTGRLGGTAGPLAFDPSTGSFGRAPAGAATAVELPDPAVEVEVAVLLDSAQDLTDTVRVRATTPRASVRLPFLRGAMLAQGAGARQGTLVADPDHADVRFWLPSVTLEVRHTPAAGVAARLVGTSTTGTPVDQIADFVRMEPPYALIGPGDVVGFAFRTAVLDLSGTAGPTVPAQARAMPAAWQGFYLPEVRLFVAPQGMDGLAVSAGVEHLWIGLGVHAGVTGTFAAEVVDRGAAPQVRVRFQDATGRSHPVPGTSGPAAVTVPEHSTVLVDAGGSLAPFTYEVTVGGVAHAGDRAPVGAPAVVEVRATDAGGRTTTRRIDVARAPAADRPAAGAQPVVVRTTSTGPTRVETVQESGREVVLRLEPAGGQVVWSWTGGPVGGTTGETATVPVEAGSVVTVTATRTSPPAVPVDVDCYFRFARPTAAEVDTPERLAAYAGNRDNVWSRPAVDRRGTAWAPGAQPVVDLRGRFDAFPAGTTFTVEGYASFDGDLDDDELNRRLSRDRARVVAAIVDGWRGAGTATVLGPPFHGDDVSQADPATPDRSFWRATVHATPPTAATETVGAQVSRAAAPPPPTDLDRPPVRPPVPDCFHSIGLEVELVRGTFVRAELYGRFDVRTAAEQRLARNALGPLPARRNAQDGICSFRLRLRVDETRRGWDVLAEFRAAEGDLDGLVEVTRPTTGDHPGLDVLGAVAVLSPLLAAAAPPDAGTAELAALGVGAAAAAAIGAAGVVRTQRVTLRGGELVVANAVVDPAAVAGPTSTTTIVLLDVETAFSFDVGILRSRPDRPLVTRYKAVGVRSQWTSEPAPGGGLQYAPLPVFDPSRGYSLDVPASSLAAAPPLDELLRVLGVRISRDNPTYLEVEVGMGVDLGIVVVDTARVRIRLDAAEFPQLSRLGARLDVPGTLHGSGYVQITPAGFTGAFDLTITPLNVRGSAQLAVETKDGVTGVLVGLEVQFPVPVPLANSGVALFGLLGGVAVNYSRAEAGLTPPPPALAWLARQLGDDRRSVMHPAGWTHAPGSYAFSAGVLLGTAEGGFVLHLKGIVMLEVPGPRLLLVMKADVLKLPPVLGKPTSATFLAMLDLDVGRGTITVGVVAEYSVERLLQIRVPVTAFFDTRAPEKWYVDLGTYRDPVTVEVLDVFTGTGYLMVHGDGIEPFDPLPGIVTSGLTIALGFHLRCLLMGSRSAGLFLEVAAGFDAIVALDPFAFAGKIYARGELRLFVVSVAASAALDVLSGRQRTVVDGVTSEVERTWIKGEVCGSVRLFFFRIRACLTLTIGEAPPPDVPPADLVAGVALVSRSPALVEGSATDRSVDGLLADAIPAGSSDPLPRVPIDAVPAVLFDVAPAVRAGGIVLGEAPRASSGAGGSWVRRGKRWWRYELVSVALAGPLLPADGRKPSTWWQARRPGAPALPPALALLDWLPTPTPRAVPYGQTLTTTVRERWSRTCDPVAAPAELLWTFDAQPAGPSPDGWELHGVPWPDDVGGWRSSPPRGTVQVRERWRCGAPLADVLRGVDPAVVVGDAVPCPVGGELRGDGIEAWLVDDPGTFSRAAGSVDVRALLELTAAVATGTHPADLPAAAVERGWDPQLAEVPLECEGRVLRSSEGDLEDPLAHVDVEEDIAAVLAELEQSGFRPSQLRDAVLLRQEGGLVQLELLLLVPGRFVHDRLVLEFSDGGGTVLGRQPVGAASEVSAAQPLPARWTDPAGPWAGPVERAGRIAARIAAQSPQSLLLVRADVPPGTVQVEVGWDIEHAESAPPPFHVVALTGVLQSEVLRHDWDSRRVVEESDALSSALTQDPDDRALLSPGQDYTVSVTWRAASLEQDSPPEVSATPAWGGEVTQSFRFGTDTSPPPSLDPWVLATTPAADETGVLCREPLRIALATQKVAALWAAYGRELRVRVLSASGRHPQPPGGGPAGGLSAPVPTAADGDLLRVADRLLVRTPWEQAAQEVADELPCVPGTGDRRDQAVLVLPYDLEPLTDYLLDVESVPRGSSPGARGDRVFRIGFTTSRYGSVQELAELLRYAPVGARVVPDPSALTALLGGPPPTGDVLDAAFARAGLDVPQQPRVPSLTVLWTADAVPQPAAVVVECPEAMQRSRPMPTTVEGPPDRGDPTHTWWAARERPWLRLAAVTGAPVAGVVMAPGGQRAVAVLASGARGRVLGLDLLLDGDDLAAVADAAVPAVRVSLTSAPWEAEV